MRKIDSLSSADLPWLKKLVKQVLIHTKAVEGGKDQNIYTADVEMMKLLAEHDFFAPDILKIFNTNLDRIEQQFKKING